MRVILPYLPLIALVAVLSAVEAARVAAGGTPSATTVWLTQLPVPFFFILWMTGDARRRQNVPCYDFGLLLGVFLPASLAWYLLWSRGWRGLILLVGFAALMSLPDFAAMLCRMTLPSNP